MAAERYTPSISFSAFVALANMRYIKVLNNNNNNNNFLWAAVDRRGSACGCGLAPRLQRLRRPYL